VVIKPPPLLLAAGLLFWGWHADFMVAAAGMALALESPRLLRLRWELSRRDFERIADLCAVGFASALVFQFVQSRHFPDSLLSVLVWLPMLFFALLLAQRYSTLDRVPLSALFWSLRRRGDDSRAGQAVPLDYAYFGVSLLAASSANPRTPGFFIGICALGLYALWPAAPKRGGRKSWVLAFVAATGLAFAIQAGLLRAQTTLEELVFEWLSHRWDPPADPYRSRTAIGDIGELKASDRIVLRVDAGGRQPPHTLRAAAYNVYAAGTWTAPAQTFMPIIPFGQTWEIAAGTGSSVWLSGWSEGDRSLLALPLGTFRLDSLNVAAMQRNGLGAVRVDEGPDMLRFEALFDAQRSLDAPPDAADLGLAGARALVQRAVDKAEQLGLRGAVAVVGASGTLITASRMDAGGPGGMARARSKAWISATQQIPSSEHLHRMTTIAPPVAAGFAQASPEALFPGAGGMPVSAGGVVVAGIAASGATVSPFFPEGVDPRVVSADGRPANPEDLLIAYALGVPYTGQHGDDQKRWEQRFGDLTVDPADSLGMAPAPPAGRQAQLDWARGLCDAVMDAATRRGVRVAVAVVDRGGDPVQQDLMDGAPAGFDGPAETREHAFFTTEMVGVEPPHALVLPHARRFLNVVEGERRVVEVGQMSRAGTARAKSGSDPGCSGLTPGAQAWH
jgi:uncharacterized protein GlcG (DUF336 family)